MQIEMKLASESHVPRFRAGVGTWRSGYMIPIRLPWRHRARPSATLHEILVCLERQTCPNDATTRDVVRQPAILSRQQAGMIGLLAAVAEHHFTGLRTRGKWSAAHRKTLSSWAEVVVREREPQPQPKSLPRAKPRGPLALLRDLRPSEEFLPLTPPALS